MKNHQANWWPNHRFPVHTVPGHCFHEEYIVYCDVGWCDAIQCDAIFLSSILADVIMKLRCSCGFVDKMLSAVQLWFHSSKLTLCICGVFALFCLNMMHLRSERFRTPNSCSTINLKYSKQLCYSIYICSYLLYDIRATYLKTVFFL